jgi:hypothetical protein
VGRGPGRAAWAGGRRWGGEACAGVCAAKHRLCELDVCSSNCVCMLAVISRCVCTLAVLGYWAALVAARVTPACTHAPAPTTAQPTHSCALLTQPPHPPATRCYRWPAAPLSTRTATARSRRLSTWQRRAGTRSRRRLYPQTRWCRRVMMGPAICGGCR